MSGTEVGAAPGPTGGTRRRDTAALLGGQAASAAGSLLLLLVSARSLGPDGRGVFTFFLLWPAIGAYVIALGIPGANLWLAAGRPERTAALAGNSLLATAVLGALLAVPLVAGARPDWLVGPMSPGATWLAWAATVAMTAFNALTWIQMGLGQYVLPNVLKGLLPCAAALLLAGWTLAPGPDPSVELACGLYAACLGVVLLAALARLARTAGPPRLDLALGRRALAYGVRYQVGLVAQLVTYRADQWVLGATRGAEPLGLYGVAASASEIATYAATARGMTTFRDAARGAAGSPRALVAETALVTGVGAVVVGGAGALLLPSLLGSGFGDAVPLLLWLLPGTLGIALMRVCGNELSGRGRPGVVAWVAGIQGIAMVVGFVALIPGHGPTAAAIVSSVGYLLGGASCAVVLVTMSRPPLSPETAPA